MKKIGFNKPYLTGKETLYITDAVASGKISGNGAYTQKCQLFFEEKYQFKKCLLTTSCTDALEMAAMLANIEQGDEVIIPAYTYAATANIVMHVGAKPVMVDTEVNSFLLDLQQVKKMISPKTKVIMPVDFSGLPVDYHAVMELAKEHQEIFVANSEAQKR